VRYLLGRGPFGGYGSSPKGYGSTTLHAIGHGAIRIRRKANSRRPSLLCSITPSEVRRFAVRGNGGSARHRSWRLWSHPDQHRPEYLVLLAVDQQLGEDAGLGEYPVGIGIADGLT
jgi:hypothetical protein